MRIFKEENLTTLNLIYILSLIFFLVLSLGYFSVSKAYRDFDDEADQMAKEYVETKRSRIRREILDIANYIETQRREMRFRLQDSVKQRVEQGYQIVESLHQGKRGSENDIKQNILAALKPIRWSGNRGFYFILDKDGIMQLHTTKQLVGNIVLEQQDARGVFMNREILKAAKSVGGGEFHFAIQRKKSSTKTQFKYTYIKFYKPLGWVIGAGEYLDDVDREVKADVLLWLRSLSLDSKNDLMVVTRDGKILLHQAHPQLEGQSVFEMGAERRVEQIQQLIKTGMKPEGDFVRYEWLNPQTGRMSERISFAKHVKGLDWIISTGLFTDDVEQDIAERRDVLKDSIREEAKYTVLISLVFTGLAVLISLAFARTFNSVLHEYREKVRTRTLELEMANESLRYESEERVEVEKQLQQAQKLEAIGTLAGGIAHDFNNILTSILGYAELCLYTLSEDDKIRSYVNEIHKAGIRAKGIVSEILFFSRKGEGEELKPIQLLPVVKDALTLIRASLPATIRIEEDYTTRSDRVLADPTRIHQIMINICMNASHAMGDNGGTLTIRLTDEDISYEDTNLLIPVAEGQYFKLQISDTGEGMDEATRAKIFDPFFTTRKQGEGTGLGLSVVHGIVSSYNGTITVDSIPGKGTTFSVFLPKTELLGEDEEELQLDIPHGSESVLLIDDEISVVEVTKKNLETLGYKVTGVSSSIDALQLFSADPKAYDLIICDQTMPEMTGVALSEDIFKVRDDVAFILCTGFSAEPLEEELKKSRIKMLLHKPLLKHELGRAIREVLD